jgi:pSer/pThr/pTyr-binding forkhead associated (FHA) protein
MLDEARRIHSLGAVLTSRPRPSREAWLSLVRTRGMVELGQRFPLDKSLVIGRGAGADVRISDPAVSRHHVTVMLGEDGLFALVDMASTNGTYLNGGRGRVHHAYLFDGDLIHLGDMTVLRFCTGAPGEAP